MNEKVIAFPQKTEVLRHRRKRRRKVWLFGFFFALWVLMLIVFTPVSGIIIEGNDAYSSEAVIKMLKLTKSNYMYYRLLYRVPPIKDFPYLDDVRMEMKGRKVVIHVVESKPCVGIEHMFGIIYISNNGKVLEFSKEPREGVAIINGLNVKDYVLGEQITFDAVEFSEIKHLVDIIGKYELPKICNNRLVINFYDTKDIVLYYDDNMIHIGDTEGFDEKIAILTEFIRQNSQIDGSIDVSNYENGIIYKENKFEKNVD